MGRKSSVAPIMYYYRNVHNANRNLRKEKEGPLNLCTSHWKEHLHHPSHHQSWDHLLMALYVLGIKISTPYTFYHLILKTTWPKHFFFFFILPNLSLKNLRHSLVKPTLEPELGGRSVLNLYHKLPLNLDNIYLN